MVDWAAREAAAAVAAKKEVVPVQSKGNTGRMTLQERLAASIAKSRSESPKLVNEDVGFSLVRSSGDITRMEPNGMSKEIGFTLPVRTETPKISGSLDVPSRTETPDLQVIPPYEPAEKATEIKELAPDVSEVSSEPLITESSHRASSVSLPTSPLPDTDPATADLISQLRSDLAACESRRIEESQRATSRISSLEQKLKILSQTTLETSKELASNPSATSWEHKLAEREEKIALLLDEGLVTSYTTMLMVGEKLAKIELNLMTNIKSLRAKQKEETNTTNAAISRAERADKQLVEMRNQLKRANEIEKKNAERLKGMYKIEAANEALRREKDGAQVCLRRKGY